MSIEKLREDPSPDCQHEWTCVGTSTICEPPIRHYACFRCRTFQHVLGDFYVTVAGQFKMNRWFTEEWPMGPWSWKEMEATYGFQ